MKLNYRQIKCCGNCTFRNFDSYDGANYCVQERFTTNPHGYEYEKRRQEEQAHFIEEDHICDEYQEIQ